MTYNVFASTPPSNGNLHALDFDGVDDHVVIPKPTNLNYNTAYTFEAWVKSPLPGNNGYYAPFFAGTAVVSDIEVYIQSGTNDMYVVHNRGNGGTLQGVQFPDPPNNVWYHLAVVYDGAQVEMFYDGISQGKFAIATPVVSSGAEINLGYVKSAAFDPAWGPKNMPGQMDDVRFWSIARLGTAVLNDMGVCLNGNESGLEAYYAFEDATGLIASDEVGGIDAVLTNMDGNTDWVDGAFSCDGVVCSFEMTQTAIVTTATVDNTVSVNANTIEANQAGATYRWLDCGNGNSVIPSEIAQTYTPLSSGNYAVEVTLNGCVDTSACQNITSNGINEIEINDVSIFPNPVTNELNVITIDQIEKIAIYSVNGVLVKGITDDKSSIDVSKIAKGMYVLVVRTNSGITQHRFIKQ